ncbi:MAG: FHA domain-containing protein [Deltaproteobacteria bacterium]|nr:FHA domain-containing protein [Deltaproteobacteria bacterium]
MVHVAYVDSDGIERSYSIGTEPVLIGREPGCTIQSNDGLVSRRHALMYVDATGMLYVEDLGSANGVFVGPHRVKVSPIPMGAIVVVGSLRFRRLASTPGASQPPAPVQEFLARAQTRAVLEPPPPPPTVAPMPGADVHAMLVHLLDVERKMRRAIEDERDAYGARLAELHRELEAARARIEELERKK